MQDNTPGKILDSELYLIAGKSFAEHLGYPSFRKYLHKSTYFYTNLNHNTIEEIYMNKAAKSVIHGYEPKTYEDYKQMLMTTWTPSPSDPDINSLFERKKLIEIYELGETFVNAYFPCTIGGVSYKKYIACHLVGVEGEVCATFLIYDVTELYDANARILHKAEYDSLTQLYNREACSVHFNEYFSLYSNDSAAVVLLDLDHFKRFNDQYGHSFGDTVLCAAAKCLERFFGRDSIVSRNGGDEFLILLKHRSADEAEDEIRQFSEELHNIEHNGIKCSFTFSIGYSMYPEDGREPNDLISKADTAMYSIKMQHRNSFIRYSYKMLSQKRTQLSFNLSDIVSGIPGAILVYKADESEEILFANQQLFDLFECDSMDELLSFSGDSFRNIVHPEDIDRVEDEIKTQLATNQYDLDFVSYRIVTKSGKIKYINDIGRLVHTQKYGDIFYVFLYDKALREKITDSF